MKTEIKVSAIWGLNPAIGLSVMNTTDRDAAVYLQLTLWSEADARRLVTELQAAIDYAFSREEAIND